MHKTTTELRTGSTHYFFWDFRPDLHEGRLLAGDVAVGDIASPCLKDGPKGEFHESYDLIVLTD